MRAAFVLLVLASLVVAFVAQAPATLLDRRVQQMTTGKVRLADAAGTVWSGRGTLAAANGRWRLPLAWRTGAADVLTGRLAITLLPTAPGEPRGTVRIGEQALDVTDLDVRLPASVIETAWGAAPVPRFDGTVTIASPAWRRVRARTDGGFDMRWEQARVTLGGLVLALGTVDAQARAVDGATRVALRNRGGDVAVDGEVLLQDDGLRVDARLTPAASLAPPLALLVRSLGTVEGDGRVHMTWQARR